MMTASPTAIPCNFRAPQSSSVEILIPELDTGGEGIRRRGLRGVIRSQGWSPVKEISALIKGILPVVWGYSETSTAQKRILTGTWHLGPLQPPEQWDRNVCRLQHFARAAQTMTTALTHFHSTSGQIMPSHSYLTAPNLGYYACPPQPRPLLKSLVPLSTFPPYQKITYSPFPGGWAMKTV